MKTYVLRIESAESVLGHLAPGKPAGLFNAAYDSFVSTLIAALGAFATEPVRIVTHSFESLEQAKASFMQPGKTYICLDSQSGLGLPRWCQPTI